MRSKEDAKKSQHATWLQGRSGQIASWCSLSVLLQHSLHYVVPRVPLLVTLKQLQRFPQGSFGMEVQHGVGENFKALPERLGEESAQSVGPYVIDSVRIPDWNGLSVLRTIVEPRIQAGTVPGTSPVG